MEGFGGFLLSALVVDPPQDEVWLIIIGYEFGPSKRILCSVARETSTSKHLEQLHPKSSHLHRVVGTAGTKIFENHGSQLP